MSQKEGRTLRWWRKMRGDEAEQGRELTRSQYSLVSSSDLTPGAMRAWTLLPPEVKYDTALEDFRQHYEKEHGSEDTFLFKNCTKGRIPSVKSAPLLHAQSTLTNIAFSDIEATSQDIQGHNGDITQNHHTTYITEKNKKIALAKHYTKITLLVGVWLFFTVIFMAYNEKEEVFKNTYVESKDLKRYILNVSDPGLTVMVKLSGPFLSEQHESNMNEDHKIHVWLERWNLGEKLNGSLEDNTLNKQVSNTWTIMLQRDPDFLPSVQRSGLVTLLPNTSSPSVYVLKMQTDSEKPVPFALSYVLNPLDFKIGVTYAFLLLLGLYALIISEIINRTMAAVLMSTTSLAVLAMVGERPTLQELITWLEVETLVLLFSMMLLVAIMAESGMFDALAVFAFQVTKGKIWPLIALLCITTALVSTFLDNVTTVLLMAPVTIRLCEVTGLDPVPILMSMVLFSNIGGTATPVGDPPNVIISSNKLVKQVGINFTNFTLHMSLGILLVCVQTYLQLRYWHIDVHRLRHSEPRDIQELRHQLAIWRRAAESLPHVSSDERVVRMRLERKIEKLTDRLNKREQQAKTRACDKEVFQTTLADLKDKYKIYDKTLLLKASVATFFAIAVFFLHSIPELNRVSLGWTALLAAILLLILVDREDLEPVLRKVEWSTLLFFAALFVNMEALSKLGLIEFIGDLTESLILMVNENSRLAVAILLIVWLSGLTLAFLDNIPLTTMMVRVVTSLGSNPALGLPLPPLIWALSFGTCLGGNGTLIGASANVVCAGVAEQHGYRFTFMQFFKIGFPVMIGHLLVVSVYLLICHCVFQWHL